jgi:hypothetical protein
MTRGNRSYLIAVAVSLAGVLWRAARTDSNHLGSTSGSSSPGHDASGASRAYGGSTVPNPHSTGRASSSYTNAGAANINAGPSGGSGRPLDGYTCAHRGYGHTCGHTRSANDNACAARGHTGDANANSCDAGHTGDAHANPCAAHADLNT